MQLELRLVTNSREAALNIIRKLMIWFHSLSLQQETQNKTEILFNPSFQFKNTFKNSN